MVTLKSLDLRQFKEGSANAVLKKIDAVESKAGNAQYKCSYRVTQGDIERTVVHYILDPLRAELEAPEIQVEEVQSLLMHIGQPEDAWQEHTIKSALEEVLESEETIPVFLTRDAERSRWNLTISAPEEPQDPKA